MRRILDHPYMAYVAMMIAGVFLFVQSCIHEHEWARLNMGIGVVMVLVGMFNIIQVRNLRLRDANKEALEKAWKDATK